MWNANLPSRRAVVCLLASAPAVPAAVPAAAADAISPDAELIALVRQLDLIPAALDRTGDHDEAMALLDKIDSLSAAVVAKPAKTLEGLCAKARATGWALQDGFDPTKESSITTRVAASIVRDLLELGTADA
jgi:hypothetical protein